MISEERVKKYLQAHPPAPEHKRAKEDLLILIECVREECAVAACSACYSQRPVYEACINSGVDDGQA